VKGVKNKLMYEIGQKTLPKGKFDLYAHLSPLERGKALIRWRKGGRSSECSELPEAVAAQGFGVVAFGNAPPSRESPSRGWTNLR